MERNPVTKAKPKQKKLRYVEVSWIDAISDSSWLTEEHFPEPALITTRGWLVKETETYITVAGTLGHGGDYGEVITIPKCWANKVKTLRVPK